MYYYILYYTKRTHHYNKSYIIFPAYIEHSSNLSTYSFLRSTNTIIIFKKPIEPNTFQQSKSTESLLNSKATTLKISFHPTKSILFPSRLPLHFCSVHPLHTRAHVVPDTWDFIFIFFHVCSGTSTFASFSWKTVKW